MVETFDIILIESEEREIVDIVNEINNGDFWKAEYMKQLKRIETLENKLQECQDCFNEL